MSVAITVLYRTVLRRLTCNDYIQSGPFLVGHPYTSHHMDWAGDTYIHPHMFHMYFKGKRTRSRRPRTPLRYEVKCAQSSSLAHRHGLRKYHQIPRYAGAEHQLKTGCLAEIHSRELSGNSNKLHHMPTNPRTIDPDIAILQVKARNNHPVGTRGNAGRQTREQLDRTRHHGTTRHTNTIMQK